LAPVSLLESKWGALRRNGCRKTPASPTISFSFPHFSNKASLGASKCHATRGHRKKAVFTSIVYAVDAEEKKQICHEFGRSYLQLTNDHFSVNGKKKGKKYIKPSITYYWTVPLILDHSYLVGKLKNSNIAETKASEPLKS
jgi:hypothetical protein